jgi:hypothetical protein
VYQTAAPGAFTLEAEALSTPRPKSDLSRGSFTREEKTVKQEMFHADLSLSHRGKVVKREKV